MLLYYSISLTIKLSSCKVFIIVMGICVKPQILDTTIQQNSIPKKQAEDRQLCRFLKKLLNIQ